MIRIKGKGITSLIMALVLSSAAVVPVLAQEISLIENTQKEIREIEVDLEVGETFHDPETGISIKRLPDNYDGRESKPLTRAYSKDLWDEDLTDKDFKGRFTLTSKAHWWKIAYRTYTNGNNIEISKGSQNQKTVYKQNKGRYDLYDLGSNGRYDVHFFNGNYGLDGWAACRIADSKAGLDLR